MSDEARVPGPLDARHRCDRCGAQAYVAVVLNSGSRLDWCAHHFDLHFPALWDSVLHIRDERDRLRNINKQKD